MELLEPEKSRNSVSAFLLAAMKTDPITLWDELEPLLKNGQPQPTDLVKMERLVENLGVLADMFEDEHSKEAFDRLSGDIISWKYAVSLGLVLPQHANYHYVRSRIEEGRRERLARPPADE